MIKKVFGPYQRKTNKSWFLRIVHENDKTRQETYPTKAKADKRKAEILGNLYSQEMIGDSLAAAPNPSKMYLPELPQDFDGSANSIKDAITEAILALNKAVRARDSDQVRLLRSYVAGLREMASAIVPHAKYIELEQECAEQAKYIDDLHAKRITLDSAKKPATHRWSTSKIKGSKRSRASLR
jgi:hypothetical protein